MKKTILLGMLAACTLTSATAANTFKVIFLGEQNITGWQYCDLDPSPLATAQVGDQIKVEGQQVTENSWTQLTLVSTDTDWSNESATFTAEASNELTGAVFTISDAATLERLQASPRFALKGDNIIINKVSIGRPDTQEAATGTLPLDLKDNETWGNSCSLDADILHNCRIGDKLTLTFEEGSTQPGEGKYVQVVIQGNTTAARLVIILDNEATGIATVRTANREQVCDLQGRRIEHPTRGLYIVNGKKMIVK